MDNFDLMQSQHKEQNPFHEDMQPPQQQDLSRSAPLMDPMYKDEILSEQQIKENEQQSAEDRAMFGTYTDLTDQKRKLDQTPKQTTSLLSDMVDLKVRAFGKSLQDSDLDNTLKLLKKRSAESGSNYTNNELYLSLADMKYINDKLKNKENVDGVTAVDAILRLYTASDAFCQTHSGISIKPDSRARNNAAALLVKMTKIFFSKFLTADEEAEIKSPGKYTMDISKASLKQLAKNMNNAAGIIKKFNKFKGETGAAKSPEQIIKEKLLVYRQYDAVIRLYRYHYQPKEWSSSARETIEEYENLLRMEKVIGYSKALKAERAAAEEKKKKEAGKQQEEKKSLDQLVNEHLEKEDNKNNKIKIDPLKVDKGLSAEQLKGIDEIDKWLIRNAQNGGLAGLLPIFNFKNDNANFVNAILSKSKRERLYIYYMVESNHRKDPTFADVAVSQHEYVPTLKGFKDKMLATKLKVYTRFTGEYTYMHKMSEANQLSEKNKDLIQLTANLENNMVEEPVKKDLSPLEEIEQDRVIAYKKFYAKLADYRNTLQKGQGVQGAGKKAAEAEAREKAAQMEKEIKDMLQTDAELKARAAMYLNPRDKETKEKVPNRAFSKKTETKTAVDYANLVFGTGLSKTVVGLNSANQSGVVNWSWGLDKKGWESLNMWTGSFANSLASVNSALSVINAIISLATKHRDMSASDIATNTITITKGAIDIAKAGSTVVDLVKAGGEYGSQILSNTTKTLGVFSACADLYLGASKYSGAELMKESYNSAKEYFDHKHAQNPESLDERKVKMEKGMLKLSNDLFHRNYTAARYHIGSATATLLSVTIPGISAPILAGVAGVGALAATIHDNYRMGKIRESMFDAYYNVDGLIDRILELKQQNCLNKSAYQPPDKKALKESVRNALCAASGNSDLVAAADHIAAEYSEHVYNMLFGPEPATGNERLAYIKVVKMFNLDYDEKKKVPSRAALCAKMKGG